MNLFELKEKKEDVKSDIKYYRNEIERLEAKVGLQAVQIKDIIVSNNPKNNREDALLELAQMIDYLDEAQKKLNNLNTLANDKFNNFKEHNDYDKQIYIEKKLFKWSNAKISARHGGITKRTINRIVKKVEENKYRKN